MTANSCALLIGVDDYSAFDASMRQPEGTSNLLGSINDVRAYRALCERLRIPKENIRVLTSPRLDPREIGVPEENVGEANEDEILASVAWLASILGQASKPTGLLTYSGHGDFSEKKGLLICPSNTEGPELEHAVPFVDLQKIILCHDAATNLSVILDCCHAEPVGVSARGRTLCLRRQRPSPKLLASAMQISDRILSACRRDQSAYQARLGAGEQGAFSWALCTVLEQWRSQSEGDSTVITVAYGELISRAGRLLEVLSFPQRPALDGREVVPYLPFMHKGLVARPGETSPEPNAGRRVGQIDGGWREGISVPRAYTIYLHTDVLGVILATGENPSTGFLPNTEYWKLATTAVPSDALRFEHTDTDAVEVYQDFLAIAEFSTAENRGWTDDYGRDPYAGQGSLFVNGNVYMRWALSYSSGQWSGQVTWYNDRACNVAPDGTFNPTSEVSGSSHYWANSTPGS